MAVTLQEIDVLSKKYDDTNYSDSDIVPDDKQNLLMYWRDQLTAGFFSIGDIANEIIFDAAKAGMKLTDHRIYGAVSKFCGRSARTVRYYAETALFYPQEIRQEYDMLPFSYFVFARTLDDWKSFLDFAMANPMMGIDVLKREYFLKQKNNNLLAEGQADKENLGDSTLALVEPIEASRPGESGQSKKNNQVVAKIILDLDSFIMKLVWLKDVVEILEIDKRAEILNNISKLSSNIEEIVIALSNLALDD